MTVDNDIGLLERTLAALGRPAWEVTAEDIDRVVGDLAVKGRKTSTRREYIQIFKGFHRFLQIRKAAEIEAAFGARLVCPVDESNASRHVGDDSPALVPPPTPERVAEFFDFMKQRIATARKYGPARMLQVTDVDPLTQTVRLGKRPHPVPLDPASWAVLERCLAHREAWPTANPHVMVTKGTKAGRSPASKAYLSHVLDDCGYPPRMIRSTRLVDLVNTMDPKLVAAAFGMDPQATLIYLADHVDEGSAAARNRRTDAR